MAENRERNRPLSGPYAGDGRGLDGRSLVLSATDIVELIGQTVSLKRRGKDYVGLCPFHQEKTPSFTVSPSKQLFRCFGCKVSGNAIDFVMKRDRIEFVDALKSLAQRAGIDLPRLGVSKEKAGERQLLLEANSAAGSLFEKWLNEAVTGKAARDYLASRGFNADSIKRFQVGLTPDAWDSLSRSPLMKKFPPALLQQAGLIKARDGKEGHYDTFRNRLMFPIRDETGRIIAFGGRKMREEDEPKYLNSPETPLFSKSKCVYGLDLARQKIVETRTVAVVEGYTDVVMAHQFGASNVVSILGTAMTEQHVQILRRFADRIVLLFDADTAGDLAVNRAVELFLTQPIEIAIASMPQGIDPDEYLLEHGADGFAKLLGNASDALSYKWKQLAADYLRTGDLTSQQKAVRSYLEVIAQARGSGPIDAIRWGATLTRVSRLTEIPVEDLHKRFRQKRQRRPLAALRNDAAEIAEAPSQESPRPTAQDRAEQWILGILLLEPHRWHDVQHRLQAEEFIDPAHRQIAELYWNHQRDEGEPNLAEFISLLDDELKDLAMRLVDEVEALSAADQTLSEAMRHLDEQRKRKQEAKLIAELRRTSDQKAQPAEETDLLRKLQEQARRPDMRRVGS